MNKDEYEKELKLLYDKALKTGDLCLAWDILRTRQVRVGDKETKK